MKLALLAAAATGMQVGAATVASRFVLAEIPPLTLAMLRYAIALTCLLPFLVPSLLRGWWPAPVAAGVPPRPAVVWLDWL